jgi:hypothetical protein
MHEVSSGNVGASIQFEGVSPDKLPPGRVCDVREGQGWLAVRMNEREVTPQLLRQLNRKCQLLLGQERWAQTEMEDDHRIEQPAEGREIATSSWHRLRDDQLPEGELCVFVELEGCCFGLIHEDHLTQQLCDEINDYLARLVGDGLWRQHWPDKN